MGGGFSAGMAQGAAASLVHAVTGVHTLSISGLVASSVVVTTQTVVSPPLTHSLAHYASSTIAPRQKKEPASNSQKKKSEPMKQHKTA